MIAPVVGSGTVTVTIASSTPGVTVTAVPRRSSWCTFEMTVPPSFWTLKPVTISACVEVTRIGLPGDPAPVTSIPAPATTLHAHSSEAQPHRFAMVYLLRVRVGDQEFAQVQVPVTGEMRR